MQPWTEALQDILVGTAIIGAVAAVFIVGPLLAQSRRTKRDSRRDALGPRERR